MGNPIRIGARFRPSRSAASNLARCDRQSAHRRLRDAGPLFAPRVCEANELGYLFLGNALFDELGVGRRDHIGILYCRLLTLLRGRAEFVRPALPVGHPKTFSSRRAPPTRGDAVIDALDGIGILLDQILGIGVIHHVDHAIENRRKQSVFPAGRAGSSLRAPDRVPPLRSLGRVRRAPHDSGLIPRIAAPRRIFVPASMLYVRILLV